MRCGWRAKTGSTLAVVLIGSLTVVIGPEANGSVTGQGVDAPLAHLFRSTEAAHQTIPVVGCAVDLRRRCSTGQ